MNAITKDGQIVYCCINNDCDENEGGYYVEIFDSEDMMELLDYFCVHTDDCDCNDWDAVENYVKQYVSSLNLTRQ